MRLAGADSLLQREEGQRRQEAEHELPGRGCGGAGRHRGGQVSGGRLGERRGLLRGKVSADQRQGQHQVPEQLGRSRGTGGGGGPAVELAGGAGGGGYRGVGGQLAGLAVQEGELVGERHLQGESADQVRGQLWLPVGRGEGAAGLQVGLGLGAGSAEVADAAGQVQGQVGGNCVYLCWPGRGGPGIVAVRSAPGGRGGLGAEAGRLQGGRGERAGVQQAHLWAEPGRSPQRGSWAAGTAGPSERRGTG